MGLQWSGVSATLTIPQQIWVNRLSLCIGVCVWWILPLEDLKHHWHPGRTPETVCRDWSVAWLSYAAVRTYHDKTLSRSRSILSTSFSSIPKFFEIRDAFSSSHWKRTKWCVCVCLETAADWLLCCRVGPPDIQEILAENWDRYVQFISGHER